MPPADPGASSTAIARRRRRPPRRPGYLWLTWLTAVAATGIAAVGWWVGKPLTPELLGFLGWLITWAGGLEGTYQRKRRGRQDAIRQIAERRQLDPDRAVTLYHALEAEAAEIERKARPALPPRRRT